jgi:ubiquinol-cytochrome c reductase cytochrome c1 subunit
MLINAMRICSRLATRRFLAIAVVECVLVTGVSALAGTVHAAEEEKAAAGLGSDWKTSKANTDVEDKASLQRGARDFANYCLGCHSLKYERWSRMAQDLDIPENLLEKDILPPGDKPAQYILTTMPAADAETWFGKTPPDLSLIARSRGKDYLYRFLTTFYIDPTRPTGANNLQLPATAMPAVLSPVEGLKRPVYKNLETRGADGKVTTEQVFDHFDIIAPGRLTPAEYDAFVRDLVNFLDYVGEPAQAARRSLGVWVVLFLLVFTWLAWLTKKEYWKDVH